LGRHVIVGSGTVILPGSRLEEGVAVGALSLVTKDCLAFGVYAGNPAKRIKERKRDLLVLEQRFLADSNAIQ
jgi:galactoside O-acetyltransferase